MGRPKGSKNKKTIAREAYVESLIGMSYDELCDEGSASVMDPWKVGKVLHEISMRVSKA